MNHIWASTSAELQTGGAETELYFTKRAQMASFSRRGTPAGLRAQRRCGHFFFHGFINAHSLREKGTFLRDCDLARSEGGRLRFGVVNLFPSTQNWIAILMQLFWKDTKGILTDSSTKSCYGRWWHGWDNVMFVILLRDVCMHSSQLKWLVAWWWMRQCTRTQTLSLHARQVTCRFLWERALSQFHSALPGRCSRGSPVTRTAAPVEVPLRRSNLNTCLQWTPSGAPPPPPLHHK